MVLEGLWSAQAGKVEEVEGLRLDVAEPLIVQSFGIQVSGESRMVLWTIVQGELSSLDHECKCECWTVDLLTSQLPVGVLSMMSELDLGFFYSTHKLIRNALTHAAIM